MASVTFRPSAQRTTAAQSANQAPRNTPAQKVVLDVLGKLFSKVDVSFVKAADGKTDLVDLTNLPNTDHGWAGGGVVFQTRNGDMSFSEVSHAILDAQKKAGVSPVIQATAIMLE